MTAKEKGASEQQTLSRTLEFKPLPLLSAYKNLGFDIKDYPNAYAQFENEITLPLHTCLTDEQQAYVIKVFAQSAGV